MNATIPDLRDYELIDDQVEFYINMGTAAIIISSIGLGMLIMGLIAWILI